MQLLNISDSFVIKSSFAFLKKDLKGNRRDNMKKKTVGALLTGALVGVELVFYLHQEKEVKLEN